MSLRSTLRTWFGCALLVSGLHASSSCAPASDPAVPRIALRENPALLPARMRRLSNAEFENTASALLGTEVVIGGRLPPDARQNGYTQNAAQTLPASLGARVANLAHELVEQAAPMRQAAWLPCPASERECIDGRIAELGRTAWRRPLSPAEQTALRALYDRAEGGSPGAGIQWVLVALLQAPSLWYLSEGSGAARGSRYGVDTVELDAYELAASLAYTVSGGPPDAALLALAESDQLRRPDVRAAQARRLLGRSSTRHHFRRFVLEWLEVDLLANTAKNPELFPTYDAVKDAMLAETTRFVDEVMVHEGASARALLDAGFTSVDATLARYYGLGAWGTRVSLGNAGRTGVLQHGSFLSAHAHDDSTSPIKRGDFVLRKVLCRPTPRPRELDIEVTIPPRDPAHTARQRFARHADDPNCSFCHVKIDGFGFAFETFDAAGRTQTFDNEAPVDARVRFPFEGVELSFADSVELSRWLAKDVRTQECFSRQAFRFFSAQAEPEIETEFLRLVRSLPAARRESLLEQVVSFVASDLFLARRVARE